ncbi:hypothetical protein TEQG_07097 [Trichophyton equinum CBS 127.97]|uniref:Uncharacterized protein n=1 Tax=Trichophyton equinum (strain ATCC MYA-4606 / CBS 127.97) TaxID=559882 RepID=F2Q1L3_TRIEC|nr:hypothetical protein TEQG_07097 [Trichophyton equinum CBS 127.97]
MYHTWVTETGVPELDDFPPETKPISLAIWGIAQSPQQLEFSHGFGRESMVTETWLGKRQYELRSTSNERGSGDAGKAQIHSGGYRPSGTDGLVMESKRSTFMRLKSLA